MGQFSYIVRLLLVAGACYVSGRLSLLLAIPPGFASPVWPPAGIALAAVLLGGYRYLPAVLIGSFALNLSIAYDLGNASHLPLATMVAFTIAAGSTLQAYVGGYLIQRAVPTPLLLEKEKEIFSLILFGGPISCVIASFIGSLTLVNAQFMPLENFLFSWFTWWVGDAIGVAVFAPVIIVFGRWSNLQDRLIIALPLIVLFSVSVYIFSYIRAAERDEHQEQFAEKAYEVAYGFEQVIQQNLDVLQAIEGFFNASNQVTAEEFVQFTDHYIKNSKGRIKSLSFNKYVPHSERALYQQWIRGQGFPDFFIKDEISAGDLEPSEKRAVYYPVTYLHPYEGNQLAHGFDTYNGTTPHSGNQRQVTLDSARDSGETRTTGRLRIVQSANEYGLLFYHPIYKSKDHPNTQKMRRKRLFGFAAGVYTIPTLMKPTMEIVEHHGMDFVLEDLSAPADRRLLFDSRTVDFKEPETPMVISDDALVVKHTIDIAGSQWMLRFIERYGVQSMQAGWLQWAVLLGGLLFTALASLMLLILVGRNQLIARVVQQKTSELMNKEAHLQAVYENMKDGSIITDAEGYIKHVNPAFERLFGYKKDKVQGSAIHRYFTATDGQPLDASTWFEPGSIIAQGVCKNRHAFPVEISTLTLHLGNEVSYHIVVRDVTKRFLAEQEREQLIKRLVQSNGELERFAYIASHDLQEPLRMIKNFTGLLRQRYHDQLDDTAQKYIHIANASAVRMQALISDLLEYACIKEGNEELEFFDGEERLRYVMTNLSDRITKQQATIVTYDDFPQLYGHPVLFASVLQNLIGNGLKYQPNNASEAEVHVECIEFMTYWEFHIRDNGIGIKPEYCEQIFEPFKRLHRREEYSGTGMGLAICRKIVENWGGKIWVESTPGNGSCFYFTMPKPHVTASSLKATG